MKKKRTEKFIQTESGYYINELALKYHHSYENYIAYKNTTKPRMTNNTINYKLKNSVINSTSKKLLNLSINILFDKENIELSEKSMSNSKSDFGKSKMEIEEEEEINLEKKKKEKKNIEKNNENREEEINLKKNFERDIFYENRYFDKIIYCKNCNEKHLKSSKCEKLCYFCLEKHKFFKCKENIICFICKDLGHRNIDCKKNKIPKSDRKCDECGNFGHFRDCKSLFFKRIFIEFLDDRKNAKCLTCGRIGHFKC